MLRNVGLFQKATAPILSKRGLWLWVCNCLRTRAWSPYQFSSIHSWRQNIYSQLCSLISHELKHSVLFSISRPFSRLLVETVLIIYLIWFFCKNISSPSLFCSIRAVCTCANVCVYVCFTWELLFFSSHFPQLDFTFELNATKQLFTTSFQKMTTQRKAMRLFVSIL